MQGKVQTSAGDCNAEKGCHLQLPPLQAVSLYLIPVTPETLKKKGNILALSWEWLSMKQAISGLLRCCARLT